MDQDLRSWGTREGLSSDIISTLTAQGFDTVSSLADLTPELITEFFQKPGILKIVQCTQLKKAIDRIGSATSGSHFGGGGGGGGGYRGSSANSVRDGFSSIRVSDEPSYAQRQATASSYKNGRGASSYNRPSPSPRTPGASSGKEETFRFLLLGKTGSGKSTTGNTIFGCDLFNTAPTFSSVTSECERRVHTRGRTNLEIMDSPGLYDTHMSQEEICMIIVQSVAGMHPGPHAILYVVRMGRYTAEEYGAYRRLKALFDDSIARYMIVLFTGGDMLEQAGAKIDELIRKSPKELQEVFRECGGRYAVFNNLAANKAPQVERLFQQVRDMNRQNGNKPYECPKYITIGKNLEEEVDRRMQEVEKKDLQRQKYVQQLETKTKDAEKSAKKAKEDFERHEKERQRQAKEEEERRKRLEEELHRKAKEQEEAFNKQQEEMARLMKEKQEHDRLMREKMEEMTERERERAREEEERRRERERDLEEKMRQQEKRMEKQRRKEREEMRRLEQDKLDFMKEQERMRREEREEMNRKEEERERRREEEMREREEHERRMEAKRKKEMEDLKQKVAEKKEPGFFGKIWRGVKSFFGFGGD